MRRPRLAAARMLVVSALLLPVAPALAISVAEPWHVDGHSMEPALQDGSVLLVDAIGPRLAGYARGDIVVVPIPASTRYPHPILVKRIVAVGGDHVRIQGGVVSINGVVAVEPYLPPGTATPTGTDPIDLVVPAGTVFVMGDHRANSFDSKAFGPVAASSIVGRAWLAVAPGGAVELPGAAAAEP
jgi:signal peptidase I